VLIHPVPRGRMLSAPTRVRQNKKTQGTFALRHYSKDASQSSRVNAKKIEIRFSGDMCVGKTP